MTHLNGKKKGKKGCPHRKKGVFVIMLDRV